MQTNLFDNPENLTNLIARLADPSTSWEKEDVNLSKIDLLIKNNMPLIVKQTENPKTAPALRESMIALSKRMEKEEKFNNPEGHRLAFEVTSIAMGIFSKGDRPQWENLPSDALKIILSNFPNSSTLTSSLEDTKYVSKEWNVNSETIQKNWVDQGIISMRAYGCKTGKEAVQCIIDKGLVSANLEDFPDITDGDLTKLIDKCPNLNHLIVKSSHTKDFPLEKLKNLQTLSLEDCSLPGKKFLDALKNFPQLTVLNLPNLQFLDLDELEVDSFEKAFKDVSKKLTHLNLESCKKIPGDQLGEALLKFTELTSLNLCGCSQIPENNLVEVIKKLPELTSLNVGWCSQLGNDFLEAMKSHSKLTHLSLASCINLPGNELAEALKTFPQLTYLNLFNCHHIPGDKLVEALSSFPQLTLLNLSYCHQIPGDKLAEALKNFSQLTHLDLSYCGQIPGDKLTGALKSLSYLTYLDLSGFEQMPEDELAEGLKNLPHLESLNLSRCNMIKGNTLVEALKSLPKLTHLDLSFIDDISLEKLAEGLKNLSDLNLSHCSLSEDNLAKILKNSPQLTVLNLKNCQGITNQMIAKWLIEYPKINFISSY